jgi:hypothetical protein
MSDDFEHKLQIYLRSERAMLDIFVRNTLRQTLGVFLGFIALLAVLIFSDIGVFVILSLYWPVQITAFILAGVHGVLFLVCIVCFRHRKHQKEVQALEDIRDYARDEVVKELKGIRRIVHGATSFFSGEGLAQLLSTVHMLLKSKS